jgi:hypothetical protein
LLWDLSVDGRLGYLLSNIVKQFRDVDKTISVSIGVAEHAFHQKVGERPMSPAERRACKCTWLLWLDRMPNICTLSVESERSAILLVTSAFGVAPRPGARRD